MIQLSEALHCVKLLLQLPRKQGTLSSDQVSPVFREPHIHHGYRPSGKPWSYYLTSLFQIHNESGNVWTHLIAFVVILVKLWRLTFGMDYPNDKDVSTFVAFCIGCLLNNFISASAHLFHSKSVWWHYVCFLVDYAGVTYYSFATTLGCVYTSSQPEVYRVIEPFALAANVCLSSVCFLSCSLAKLRCSDRNHFKRKLLMVCVMGLYALLGGMPLFSRYVYCFNDAQCHLSSLNHVTRICFLLFCCACLFSAHFPERMFPGCFDFVGHGHQWFHVFSLVTMLTEIDGMQQDVTNGIAVHTTPNLRHFVLSYLTVILIHGCILWSLRDLIRAKVQSTESVDKHK